MENKMYAKPQYKCAICDTVYDDLKQRVACESACLKKQEEEAKKTAELKKKQEHDKCKAFTDTKVTEAINAMREYEKKYGFYTYETSDVDVGNGVLDIIRFLQSMGV